MKRQKAEGEFLNQPDMHCVMDIICDLLTRQSGGRLEYSYTLTPKDGNNNDNKRKEIQRNG